MPFVATRTPTFKLQVTHPHKRLIHLPVSPHLPLFNPLSLRGTHSNFDRAEEGPPRYTFKELLKDYGAHTHTHKQVLAYKFSKAYVSLIQLTVSRKHGC